MSTVMWVPQYPSPCVPYQFTSDLEAKGEVNRSESQDDDGRWVGSETGGNDCGEASSTVRGGKRPRGEKGRDKDTGRSQEEQPLFPQAARDKEREKERPTNEYEMRQPEAGKGMTANARVEEQMSEELEEKEGNKNQNQKKKAVEKASQKAKRESRKEGLNPKLEPDGEFAEAP
ncbi:uncharacterized protein An04g06850 [Aspergillus niger]|uniref:Contig An04c0190, genomic contig n=2 Tax=Aspergillus niger TaxID=5061 RepID=A2QJF0_ASPNC|nr:uncharacterized protein An04g06850 [Aspergillus niger]CAK44685.1 unnamed protein product [Aspergillus niger]